MTEKILACPFCGSTKTIAVDNGITEYYCKCNDCNSFGPRSKSKADAILLWNAAANALAKKDEEIERHRSEINRLAILATCRNDEIEKLRRENNGRNLEIADLNEKIEILRKSVEFWQEATEFWQEATSERTLSRDEARKVARVWYNAAGVWKVKHDEYKLAYQTLYAMVRIGARTEPPTSRVDATEERER